MNRDGQERLAPLADLGPLGDVAQAVEIEVRAAVDRHEGAVAKAVLGGVALQPRQRHSAGRLGDGARLVEDVLHGRADLVGRDGDDLVEADAADAEGFRSGLAHRHAVREQPDAVQHDALVGCERRLHAGRIVGLDPDHLDVGPQELDESRHAGRKAAAPDRHEDGLERARMLLQDLGADRALAGDHIGIVVRVHEGEAARVAEVDCMAVGLVEIVAVDHGMATPRLDARDLDARRRARHHDSGGDAELLGREGDALGVVTG